MVTHPPGRTWTFGWRMLRRTPVITAAAVLSLALGIGANTAIVSMMNSVMWKSLASRPAGGPFHLELRVCAFSQLSWRVAARDRCVP